MSDTPSIPRGHFLASGSGVVDRPELQYPFDVSADRDAFMERAERERKERRNKKEKRDREKVKLMQEGLATKRAAKFEEQRIQALALFADGHNYASIALQLGVGKCRAHELVDEDYHQTVKRRKALCEANRRAAA